MEKRSLILPSNTKIGCISLLNSFYKYNFELNIDGYWIAGHKTTIRRVFALVIDIFPYFQTLNN